MTTVAASLIDDVRRYRALGWSLIPISHQSKAPAVKWRRFTKQRPRQRDLNRWFSEPCNVAVVLGNVSGGLCVRDFDVAASYHDWAAEHSALADTLPTSRTERGFHVFARMDREVGDTGVLTLPDGEMRLRNCHVTLPPSIHESGRRYEWIREPFHGVPLVYCLESAGLISGLNKTVFHGARARPNLPAISSHLITRREGARPAVFSPGGDVDPSAFDALFGWTLPSGPGMRERCLWQFARALKTLDETRHFRVDELEPLARRWWQMALPRIQTKEWFETWAAFARCWERVKSALPDKGAVLAAVVERARRAGCPPELMTRYGSDVCGLVAAICRELSIDAGGGPFFLDSKSLGRLCGIHQATASACLRSLIASRVIRKAAEPERGKATEYQWLR